MKKYEIYFNEIMNKKIAVIAIGISNTPLIRLLAKNGAKVCAFDKRIDAVDDCLAQEFGKLGVVWQLGEGYLDKLSDYDIIFKTPGMRYDLPELVKAREDGAVVTSEMEVFFDLCPAKIIAVTGSDGKTTTTTLTYEMLKSAGLNVFLGGNIGNPVLPQIENIDENAIVVLELSSFQLHTMRKSANVAVITNISPNHLDMHKSYDEYIQAKKNIYLYQKDEDVLILNADNPVTAEIKRDAVWFSRKNRVKNGAWVNENGDIIYSDNTSDTFIMNVKEIKILGDHNIENYLAAICATRGLVKNEDIIRVAKEFNGVEHRIEFVRRVNNVNYYNSSIDSSPSRTIAALSVFKDKVILIAGGKDKGIEYDTLGEHIYNKVKKLILIGATADKIYKSLTDYCDANKFQCKIDIYYADSYEQVVKIASEVSQEGDNVILSPASTSFDMFKNFEQRGNTFKALVNDL